jgi:YHS domain-containing protein
MRTIAKACGAWIVWGCLALQASAQQGIQWQSDLEAAKQIAAASNRLVLMHFSASWCHWCKPLETNVFGQPQVAQALEANYVAVRMDYDQHRQVAKQYGVRGVPWDVVVTPDGSWVEDFNSPQTADQYAARVSKIASREAAKMNAMYAQQAPAQPASPPGAPVGYGNPADPYARAQPPVQKPAPTDRYADYYASRQQPRVDPVNPPYAGQVPAGPAAAQSQPMAPWQNNELAMAQGGANPGSAPALNAPFGNPGGPPAGGLGMPASPAPVAQPTFAMDGHCPVHLLEQSAWVSGDRAWGATHRGKTYLFVSEGCQKKFLADPDRYAPALSGNDPVALVDRGQAVPGKREHGCYFGVEPNRRIVLFADEASYQTFSRNPQRYAGQILAPQP